MIRFSFATLDSAYLAQRFIEKGETTFFAVDLYDLAIILVGLLITVAVILPRLISDRKILTAPLLYLLTGALVFLLPQAPALPDLVENPWWPKRITELGVIVALTSAGLKLNRPFARYSWRISWRLLAFTMPLTIIASAVLGWWALGFVPATALLLGAVIAPTDPVLAADVQTSRPGKPDTSQTKLALTTEAGLNDGLAFPFTNLAIAVMLVGTSPANWLSGWLAIDFFYKIIVGALVGFVSGWTLARLLFGFSATRRLAKTMTGITTLSLTLLPYGIAELCASYGFIAVFAAACTFRQFECDHEYQITLHDFSEEIERVMVAILMFFIGAYAVNVLSEYLTLNLFLVALAIIFLIRPLSGSLGLVGSQLSRKKRLAVSFLGIRGIGSIYYLAYAIYHVKFPDAMQLWTLIITTIIVSVFVHGILANPIMSWALKEDKQ
ncbi:MAG: cation:proton antiporter [Candidatus Cloacimonadales bacterium]